MTRDEYFMLDVFSDSSSFESKPFEGETDAEFMQRSIAISLKRIADALENIVEKDS